jgi:hypothetical protein
MNHDNARGIMGNGKRDFYNPHAIYWNNGE